jgi:uncharacterized phage protein (TIGR01671 family)
MSREIKFRAWHNEYGNPMYEPYMSFSNNSLGLSMFFKSVEEEPCNVEVMQYTGLKDKNGVEIYEGDIVELFENKNGGLEVVFINAYVGGWCLSSHDCENVVSLGARKRDDIEVIGNIYETPELLSQLDEPKTKKGEKNEKSKA